jgi:hypothetical protein
MRSAPGQGQGDARAVSRHTRGKGGSHVGAQAAGKGSTGSERGARSEAVVAAALGQPTNVSHALHFDGAFWPLTVM